VPYVARTQARDMQFPYIDEESERVVGVTLTLHAKCTGDEPVLVTSDDLISEDPDILPLGHPLAPRAGLGDDDMGAQRKARAF
jgi:hypothetical protein